MRRVLVVAGLLSALLIGATAQARSSGGRVHVPGHTTKSGTHVAPHVRSAPNSTKRDNWSSKGNVNPHTGKAGTKNTTP
jgi:hypothetical protein